MPFPFVERPRLRPRPVLLITPELAGAGAVAWGLMITSAENAGWPDDVSLAERYQEFGLPVPCVVRPAKVATVRLTDAPVLGQVDDQVLHEVRGKLRGLLRL